MSHSQYRYPRWQGWLFLIGLATLSVAAVWAALWAFAWLLGKL